MVRHRVSVTGRTRSKTGSRPRFGARVRTARPLARRAPVGRAGPGRRRLVRDRRPVLGAVGSAVGNRPGRLLLLVPVAWTTRTPGPTGPTDRLRVFAGVPAARSQPIRILPWQAYMAAGPLILLGAVVVLTGRRWLAVGVVLGLIELAGGNIHLLLAAAIVLGFRWPWTWSLVLLTKITPGIGLLWFVVRREWRNLAHRARRDGAIVRRSRSCVMPGRLAAMGRGPGPGRGSGRHMGGGADPVRRPAPGRRRGRRLGRLDRSALDGPGGRDARPAGAVVRRPVDAAGGHRPAREREPVRPSRPASGQSGRRPA